MELGQKIRAARLEAGLSQRQLCGDTITRNMLSQIENGIALPSMDTLLYLANALEKPMGYFLEDATEKEDPLCRAKQAYRNGDYESALEALGQLPRDDEKNLLKLMSLLSLAEQAISKNRRPYARQLLEEAARTEENTIYAAESLRTKRLILQAKAEPSSAMSAAKLLPDNDEALLLRARVALEQEELDACDAYLNACEDKNAELWHLLSGERCLKSKDFAHAADHYTAAEDAYPPDCVHPLLADGLHILHPAGCPRQ